MLRSFVRAACSAMVVSSVVAFQPSVMPIRVATQSKPVSFSSPIASSSRNNALQYRDSSLDLSVPWRRAESSTDESVSVPSRSRTLARKVLVRSATAFGALLLVQTQMAPPAFAKATAAVTEEHLHVGQKIARYLSTSFGLPNWAVLAVISAMPVVELRGAIPVGIWMDLPISQVLPICVLGNMVPIIPLLYMLKNERLKKMMKPILDRAEKKASGLGVGSVEKQWVSLAAFVGIPLPGTGAWTGAMGAFLLGMPTLTAISSIFAGVVSAGMIMSAITLAGKKGGIAALAVLLCVAGKELVSGGDDEVSDVVEESDPEPTE